MRVKPIYMKVLAWFLAFSFFWPFLPQAAGAAGAAPSGEEIMAALDRALNSYQGTILMDLTVVRPGGTPRTSRLQVYISGTEKMCLRYLEPAREKGQGYLRVGDEIWMYLPNAGRSLRMSGRQNLQGTDLANDDLLRLDLFRDYDPVLVGEETVEEQKCWVVQLTTTDPSVTYGKMIYWVRKNDSLPVKTEYYSFAGKLLKTMYYKVIQEIGGLVRPVRMEVHSNLREGYQTILTMIEADFTKAIDDAVFTRDFLEQKY